MPSIKQLQYFCALAREGNMTRLAKKLYVSQTALSSAISRLEAELGVTLFNRSISGIETNRFGDLYLKYAEEILDMFEKANAELNALQCRGNSSLSVAFNSPLLYVHLLAGFIQQFPSYTVKSTKCNIEQIEKSLPNMNIDVILAGTDDFSSPFLESEVISRDRIYVCVHNSHRFSDRREITLEECSGEKFIFQEEESGFSRFSKKLFDRAGFKPNVVMWCDSTQRKMMIEQQIGVALASDATLRANYYDDCVHIPLSPHTVREMSLFWRAEKNVPEHIEAFIRYTKSYFEQMI